MAFLNEFFKKLVKYELWQHNIIITGTSQIHAELYILCSAFLPPHICTSFGKFHKNIYFGFLHPLGIFLLP